MKSENILIEDSYSCQSCQKTFNRSYTKISPNVWPVCSKICEFRVIHKFLKNSGLSDENLEFMQQIALNVGKIESFDRRTAIYDITKFYANKGLSSIKLLKREGTKGQGQKTRDKNLDRRDKGQGFPPYYIGGLSLSLSQLSEDSNSDSCPSFRKVKINKNDGRLEKWF